MLIKLIKKIRHKFISPKKISSICEERIEHYLANGRVAWSEGYLEYKIQSILNNIQSEEILNKFRIKKIPAGYGYKLDERIIEYPWLLSNLPEYSAKMLDAGSTFNFDYCISHPYVSSKELTIHTFYPEKINFNEKCISYVYGDLRDTPYKDNFFDIVVSQSTIEHIGMDNSIYGYSNTDDVGQAEKKSYQYLKATDEFTRILKKRGLLLITFPYGKFENHGFFQQLDNEMLEKILRGMKAHGTYELFFFRYTKSGWIFAPQEDCENEVSYNPHTGKGKGVDGAAHCRCICCIKFFKNE